MLTIGAKLGEVTLFYLVTVFTLSYATTKLGIPRQQALNAIMLAAGLACGTIPLFGVLGDRIGQRRVFALGGLYLALFAVPMFWMIDSRDPTLYFPSRDRRLIDRSPFYVRAGAEPLCGSVSHRNSLLRSVPGLSGWRGDRRWSRADLGDIAPRAFRDESADRSLPRWSRSACGYLCRIDAAGPTRCFVVD